MDLRRRLRGWPRVALGLAVVVLLFVLTLRLAELGPELVLNQFLLPALAITLVVLVLGMAGVLIRNLVKLVVERKRGILGSRLRSKLVFFFLALVLAPALVLFSGSVQLIKRTVEGMLRTPVEDITGHSVRIVDAWRDRLESECRESASRIAAALIRTDLLSGDPGEGLSAWLDRRRESERVDWVLVTRGTRPLARAGDPSRLTVERLEQLGTGLDRVIARALQESAPATRIDHVGEQLEVQGMAPLTVPGGPPRGVVVVGAMLPVEMAERMAAVVEARNAFQRFRLQRRELVALYLYLIALIFLVTLFVATWIGFYLARRITGPIQELAAASREISTGNLGVRVSAAVGDEIGTLVDAFNEMAAELQESREVITRSTADLRRSNRALDERRRYIETLIANVSTAVVSVDGEGRVTTANPAAEAILGIRLEVGQALMPLLGGRGSPLGELLASSLERGVETTAGDVVLSGSAGERRVAVRVSPLAGASGESLGTLLMVEDLTDLVRGQRAAAWREVARRIAHEIKNPLTPIQLSAQRLRKKFTERAEDVESVVAEATDTIEREVGGLKRLVDEFSRFARMPEIHPRPVPLVEVVEPVLSLYRGVNDVAWDVDTAEAPEIVTVDPEQMRRALVNLIDNALAAMDGRGSLRIRAGCPAGPGSLRLEVADSGPGIPPRDRDRLFIPYFSTKHRGTGLGLALVHRVVTDHRGTIRVEDNRPHGARFVIEIPA